MYNSINCHNLFYLFPNAIILFTRNYCILKGWFHPRIVFSISAWSRPDCPRWINFFYLPDCHPESPRKCDQKLSSRGSARIWWGSGANTPSTLRTTLGREPGTIATKTILGEMAALPFKLYSVIFTVSERTWKSTEQANKVYKGPIVLKLL